MPYIILLLALCSSALLAKELSLLNVSYDPTREFYEEFNQLFKAHWQKEKNQKMTIRQSHGGSGKQARAIIDGLPADVATLALAHDLDTLASKGKLIPRDWQKRLPYNSCPYTSTIVFLVRAGNPKKIQDWDDLVKPGVTVVAPNPKTSGGARWGYLAAWHFATVKYGSGSAQDFVARLYKNVPALDTGARASTTTFVHRGIGDILIAWENEALLAIQENPSAGFILIRPSISILAEPPVTVIDKVVKRKGTEELASAYLAFLYSEAGQALAAKHFYRPSSPEVRSRFESLFPKMEMVTVDDAFGGWAKAQTTHFNEGGTFDKIFRK